ncbi:MAG: class I SAM-dependent methyltransferase, partial [Rhodospirillales bacterium]|nr:class I SAM-dependent methyltransferase [Rhodospirillales bacterium]
RELGLDIRQGYFTEDTLSDGPWDVIISTEVIEHLSEPPAFLRLMRRAIAEDGILLLTTPNADWITPALSNGELYALLAPGAHVVLQSPQSLRMALEAAGFAHVVVRAEESALVAYASPSPFTLEEDFASRRAIYRRYLQSRAAASRLGSDLQIGFAGRAIFDSVNDQDEAGAQATWAVLNEASAARYGYRLEELAALPPGAEADSLEGLGAKMPVGLGMILFSRAMQRLVAGEGRQAVRPMLVLAGQAIEALQSALDHRSLGRDRLSVAIGAVVRTELLLCDAEAGKPEAAEALLVMGDKMAGWRGFVALVNAEAYAAAARLHAGLLSALPDAAIPAGLRRDALLSLANFHLAPGGDSALALPVADELAALEVPADEIRLGSFVRLVNGGRYEEALALAAQHNVTAMAARAGGDAARDAGLARAVLDLAAGDPADVPGRLEGMEIDPARRVALLLGAFTGLVNDGRYDKADELAGAHDLLALLDGRDGQAAEDARWAAMMLDLQQGRTDAAVARVLALEKAGGDKTLLAGFYVDGFVRLVNDERYDAARAMEGVEHRLPYCQEALRQDALFATGVLHMQEKAEWPRGAAAFARLRNSLVKEHPPGETEPAVPAPLFWPALRGEVVILQRLKRGEEAVGLLRAYLPTYQGAPEDLRMQVEGG